MIKHAHEANKCYSKQCGVEQFGIRKRLILYCSKLILILQPKPTVTHRINRIEFPQKVKLINSKSINTLILEYKKFYS
jgi:hypothetical protein